MLPNRVDIYTLFLSNARVSGGIFAQSPLRAFMASLGTIGVGVWLEVCLSLGFFCCCDQCHNHKQLGEESAYFSFRLESDKNGGQGRKLGGRNWRTGCGGQGGTLLTGLIPMAHSVCSVIPPGIPWPEVPPPPVAWAFLHQLLIKKMCCKLSPGPIWWRRFPNWGSLFPDNSSQADKN